MIEILKMLLTLGVESIGLRKQTQPHREKKYADSEELRDLEETIAINKKQPRLMRLIEQAKQREILHKTYMQKLEAIEQEMLIGEKEEEEIDDKIEAEITGESLSKFKTRRLLKQQKRAAKKNIKPKI